ncbi:Uncharacterised protein [Leclercia adecarboxylata]|uniref:Uncharacterized protein n=1 Tax=Leclercia adecarboxylata TaxID=83655 RepID=A0A4U9HP48_9ENTR|nr:Uncharacterised protein [Leclercia adecarboxylata]
MHPACFIHLAHGGIDDRVAGLSILPGPQLSLVCLPLDVIRPTNEGSIFTQIRVIRHQVAIKLSPDQFI